MLFSTWYVPLYNYAYSILHDQFEAEDMVQRTFYKLWDQRSDIVIHTSIKSYLYRMVHNNCLNKVKQQKIRSEHAVHIAYNSGSDSVNHTEHVVLHTELQTQIEKAIESLPPRCREVFSKSRFEQLSYAEIAKEMNISPATVETQIVKALRILREQLKDYVPLLIILLMLTKSE
ncbi:RNA polymerase sigma-70 factor [Paludibacter sp. 221]|nr:RNA polymerase sigma-70 factor [Paludibacter sp. 221]